LQAYQAQLEFNERTRLIIQTIRHYPAQWHERPLAQSVLQCAEHILPDWSLPRLGLQKACALEIQVTQWALKLISGPIQWTLDQDGVAAVSRRRAAAA
jgi:hypothetical protein